MALNKFDVTAAEPEVSVVMSVFNGGGDLEATVRSVLEQQGCEFEFIVIDDGSKDSSPALLDQMASADSRLRIIHQQNQGLTRSLIAGCSLARAPLIARQDCGDLSYPGRLARLSACMRASPQLAFVASACRHVGPHGEFLGTVSPQDNNETLQQILLTGDPATLYGPHHGTVMFRRSAYEKVGGYRPAFYFAQDLDLWTRLASVGGIDYLSEVLYEIKFTYGSITARQVSRQRALRDLIAEATRRRRLGEADVEILERAGAIRPSAALPSSQDDADINYFLGSCLAESDPLASRRYFMSAIRERPMMMKAWAKLLRTAWRGRGR
jgi:glycosyltransferase involved in cell wall biosynthesis